MFASIFSPCWTKIAFLLAVLGVLTMLTGMYLVFRTLPPDAVQGHTVRIMFVHVPAASLSLLFYVLLALCALGGLIGRRTAGSILAIGFGYVGFWLTALALITGSLWGKPMWGTFWAWDARLSSELLLLFLYMGFLALEHAFEDTATADRLSALFATVGLINIPIIKYSVRWWHTLHQPSSFSSEGITIAPVFLQPLSLMSGGLLLFALSLSHQKAFHIFLQRQIQRCLKQNLYDKARA